MPRVDRWIKSLDEFLSKDETTRFHSCCSKDLSLKQFSRMVATQRWSAAVCKVATIDRRKRCSFKDSSRRTAGSG